MKSFQNFANNIVEAERKAFGSPSGQDPQGEPMYTRRPGPNEQGRRAEVQKSPKTPTQVKGEIEAAKAFKGIKSGGLETRTNIPSKVTQLRQARATSAGTPDPWFSKKGGKKFSFTQQDIEKATTKLQNPMRARGGSQAFSDFINDYSKTAKISKSSALRQAIEIPDNQTTFKKIFGQALKSQKRAQLQNPSQPRQLGLFGSDQPIAAKTKTPEPLLEPKKPSTKVSPGQLNISDIKPPEPVKQAEVSKRAAAYRASQKPPTTPTELGGTPKSVSFSTPTRSKTSSPKKSSVLDVSAKEVPGTKFVEPSVKPKQLPGLSLGQEPAGKMVSVRPGESQTIKPQQGPGRTGVLGKPKAGQMVGAKIEPVRVVDITSNKPQITGKGAVKSTPVSIPTPSKPKVRAINNVKPAPTPVKIPQPAKPKIVTKTTTNLGQQVVDALKAEKQATLSAKQAEKAAKALKVAKGVRNIGRVAGAAGAGFDAYAGYQAARESGASKKRSLGAGAARAAGGLIGGTIGSGLGSVLGLPGAVAGGIAGYGAGTELATKAYNKLTGPAGKDFKLSDLRKNISSTASSGKKSFKSFVSQLDRKLERYA